MNDLATTATEINRLHQQAHLPPAKPRTSLGVWAGDVWIPEPSFLYCIATYNGTYWVAPAPGEGTHVSRLYSGERMSTDGFAWRYTIFAENNDPDLSDQWYVGTRSAPLNRAGVHGILKSYGLDDFKGAKIKGVRFDDTLERPFGEPDPGQWYWDAPLPDDDFYVNLQIEGMVNEHGVPLLL